MKTITLRPPPDQPALSTDDWPDTRCLPWVIDLTEWLRLRGYGLAERQRILTSLLDHGTFVFSAESGLLDPEDYPLAEAIFCESQPIVPYGDERWLCSDLWQLGPHRSLPAPEPTASKEAWQKLREELGLTELPRISGGAPVVDTLERCAVLADRIIRLQAELDSVPADWRENYYPY